MPRYHSPCFCFMFIRETTSHTDGARTGAGVGIGYCWGFVGPKVLYTIHPSNTEIQYWHVNFNVNLVHFRLGILLLFIMCNGIPWDWTHTPHKGCRLVCIIQLFWWKGMRNCVTGLSNALCRWNLINACQSIAEISQRTIPALQNYLTYKWKIIDWYFVFKSYK